MVTYVVIFIVLLACELLYFRMADRFNIIDKPNERSSHSTIVLRGGGIIFAIAVWLWLGYRLMINDPTTGSGLVPGLLIGDCYPFFLLALTLVAGVSFIDDIHSLPDSVRLVTQFVAMGLMFYQLDMVHWHLWWLVLLGFFVCVGATNIINFMDGINGITGGYSLAVLIPLLLVNGSWFMMKGEGFMEPSFLIVVILAVVVFCLFNFRPRGKAKCFAGDVGSIGIAFILLFAIGKLAMATNDLSWFVFLIVYGVDGCCTIVHRIMLHENLGLAHRKHAYQLMANELKMSHVTVSLIYMFLQLAVSLGFIGMTWVMHDNASTGSAQAHNDDIVLAHWIYLIGAFAILAFAYVLFMKKYYHLHEEYLRSIKR